MEDTRDNLIWCATVLEEVGLLSSSRMREMCGFTILEQRDNRKRWVAENPDMLEQIRVFNQLQVEYEAQRPKNSTSPPIVNQVRAGVEQAIRAALQRSVGQDMNPEAAKKAMHELLQRLEAEGAIRSYDFNIKVTKKGEREMVVSFELPDEPLQ